MLSVDTEGLPIIVDSMAIIKLRLNDKKIILEKERLVIIDAEWGEMMQVVQAQREGSNRIRGHHGIEVVEPKRSARGVKVCRDHSALLAS